MSVLVVIGYGRRWLPLRGKHGGADSARHERTSARQPRTGAAL